LPDARLFRRAGVFLAAVAREVTLLRAGFFGAAFFADFFGGEFFFGAFLVGFLLDIFLRAFVFAMPEV
jgi:hypothetical protein